jgi:hypothetical protein
MDDPLGSLTEVEKKTLLGVLRAIKGLRYGYVQLVIQDSVVVQIDRTEKVRIDKKKEWNYEI